MPGQRFKFWIKIEILDKKSKFWSKSAVNNNTFFLTNGNCGQKFTVNRNIFFCQKSKF